MPVYFIRSEQVADGQVLLTPDLAHHLGNVLRLKTGETVRLVDETPKQYMARVLTVPPNPMTLQIESETLRPAQDSPRIRMCVALIKRDKMDWIVQKSTELGVSRISPVLTERTVIRPDLNRSKRQVARWETIAKEAAQQSCRWDLPVIDSPVDVKTVFAEPSKNPGFRFIFSEYSPPLSATKAIETRIRTGGDSGMFLVGPEGGWTDSELAQAETEGFTSLSLGARILRTETAAIAALSILQYEWQHGNHHTRGG